MPTRDVFTHTEADAAAFERATGYDDRPSRSELEREAADDDFHWPPFSCPHALDTGCRARFWYPEAPAVAYHVAVDHPQPCSLCRVNDGIGRRETDGALVCWGCTPDHIDKLVPPWVTDAETAQRWKARIHRNDNPLRSTP